ncbi:hypothetical protein OAN02_00050 [bacterium]|nr:hypothetical protein [bacterium]
MAYIGNTPAENYASFLTETFTVSATTNYTLSHAVTNENEIRLVINGVVQQPGSGKAYTASGTTLTLTSATVSGDVMYAVYLGRALQTVNPPAASVGNSQTAPTIITGQTAETSIATDDTILIHDTSASALRKMTRANFVSGIGGANTPMVSVDKTGGSQSISATTNTKITLNTERVDSNSAFTSNTFTVPSGQAGNYFLTSHARVDSLTGASEYAQVEIANTNRSTVYTTNLVAGQTGYGFHAISSSVIRSLSVGDTVSLWTYGTEAYSIAEDNCNLTIIKLID